ncbi:MAG: hypothetical protein IH804_04095 [Planctomycetes bacterium]|nr:hypothetical protein [Planctomycetota bacterium]
MADLEGEADDHEHLAPRARADLAEQHAPRLHRGDGGGALAGETAGLGQGGLLEKHREVAPVDGADGAGPVEQGGERVGDVAQGGNGRGHREAAVRCERRIVAGSGPALGEHLVDVGVAFAQDALGQQARRGAVGDVRERDRREPVRRRPAGPPTPGPQQESAAAGVRLRCGDGSQPGLDFLIGRLREPAAEVALEPGFAPRLDEVGIRHSLPRDRRAAGPEPQDDGQRPVLLEAGLAGGGVGCRADAHQMRVAPRWAFGTR